MTAHRDCVFCKIVAGEIPSHNVLTTEAARAFLDVGPLADGHLLLIPTEHYERLEEMPTEVAAEVCGLLPRLGRALLQVTGSPGYNVLQNNGAVAGQVVPHVHFHLIPRVEGDGLGYRWLPQSYREGRAEALHREFQAVLGG